MFFAISSLPTFKLFSVFRSLIASARLSISLNLYVSHDLRHYVFVNVHLTLPFSKMHEIYHTSKLYNKNHNNNSKNNVDC